MAYIQSLHNKQPTWGENCWFAANATLVGDVQMGRECSVWFQAVIRGDVSPISIGDRCNIKDGGRTTRHFSAELCVYR